MNSTKHTELTDDLASSLRELVGGREELAITTLDEDEVGHLGAVCTRIAELVRKRDVREWMEEDEGGKQSAVVDIVNALADRGKLGCREEETVRRIPSYTTHDLTRACRWCSSASSRSPSTPCGNP